VTGSGGGGEREMGGQVGRREEGDGGSGEGVVEVPYEKEVWERVPKFPQGRRALLRLIEWRSQWTYCRGGRSWVVGGEKTNKLFFRGEKGLRSIQKESSLKEARFNLQVTGGEGGHGVRKREGPSVSQIGGIDTPGKKLPEGRPGIKHGYLQERKGGKNERHFPGQTIQQKKNGGK